MKRGIKYTLLGVLAIMVIGATYMLNFGLYPRFFDISWDEEVQLHDGRVIVVHVTNTYERLGARVKPYEENRIIFRRKALVFEVEPGQSQVLTTRLPVAYLGQFEKKWYAVISGQGPYGNHPDEMPTRWGSDFTTLEQRLVTLGDGAFDPIQWDAAPPQLTKMNLIESAFFPEFVAWDGKRLTLDQKRTFNTTHPTPYNQEITRPSRLQKTQGESK